MKKSIKQYFYIVLCLFMVCLQACQDKQWDDHSKISEEGLDVNLAKAIQSTPEGNSFYQALIKTGYDYLLNTANNFTVFVPGNDAWAGVDMNDTEQLKKIVAGHIAYEKILSTSSALYGRLQMVNGKIVRYDQQTQSFNGAKIVSADHVAGNGVFHQMDQVMEMKENIWDFIYTIEDNTQLQYLKSLNYQEMDMDRSIQTGVNEIGQPVYDTAWINVNSFLKVVPLDDETQELTYIVLKNDGFDHLHQKYKPYFVSSTKEATDSLTKFNVCMDFVFEGIRDITQYDTLENVFGVKVPLKDVVIEDVYDASNGRVYVIDQSNILLKEKIKPVMIEGENFSSTTDADFVYVRYKLWASGTRDVMLSCGTTQTDTLHTIGSAGQDSAYTASKTFVWNSNKRSNVNNFFIEYKAQVNSVDYEIYYVAYDDITDHSSNPAQTLRIDQKLFVSMPGQKVLEKSENAVKNNYLGDATCFVSQDTAGIHQEKKMRRWTLQNTTTQLIKEPVAGDEATIMSVPQTGNMTLWLCNTARSTSASAQGMLFLDYIRLVPKLPEE